MPTGTATVTAKSGPAVQSTAIALTGVSSFSVDLLRKTIQLYQGAQLTGPCKEFDLTGVTTFTVTTPDTAPALTIS